MRRFAEEILSKIDVEIRLKNCDVNLVMDNALYMVKFIAPMYERLREMVISYSFPSVEDEIYFFKELKPEILSKYIYFSKVYHIELKCPDGVRTGCMSGVWRSFPLSAHTARYAVRTLARGS